MTKKAKKELLDSVRANVQNIVTVNGEVKLREVYFVKGGWGSPRRHVSFDDMINSPVETLKRHPRLRKKFDVSDEAYELILKTPMDELSNILNYKDDAKKANNTGRTEKEVHPDKE